MFYTGVGSRETPIHVLNQMTAIGRSLAERGITLRSGGATGADTAFERGCDEVGGNKEIYLPWNGFNGLFQNQGYIVGDNPNAEAIAESLHPAWHRCSPGARKLHTRNVYQVLGATLDNPSSILVCWTPGGKLVGGTAMAIRMAMLNDITVINLYQ